MWFNSKAVQTISEYKPFKRTYLESSTISELKQAGVVQCQHGPHPKIGRTHFGGILYLNAHIRKQNTLKILCFVICVDDHHKLVQPQFLIHPPPPPSAIFRETSKLQNRRHLFDVELYLTVHKSFVSTSLNIIQQGCTFHLSYPYLDAYFIIRKYKEFNHRHRAQININSDKNITQ